MNINLDKPNGEKAHAIQSFKKVSTEYRVVC